MVEVIVAGAINWDINLFVQSFPRPGEETPVIRIARGPGGKGGNASVAAARLLGPTKVALIGTLGLDDIAEKQLQLLKVEGVDTSGVSRKADVESGQAYVIIDESGENVVHTYFGANAALYPEDILGKATQEMIESARITAITDPPEATAEAVTATAHKAGGLIAWDPGIRAKAGMERLRSMLMRASYVLLNEAEVEYMTGIGEPAEAAKRLSELNPRLKAILKSGKDGCTMFKQHVVTRIPGIDLAKHGMRVVNTVGSGDAFLGAFSAAKALDLSDEEALGWANWAGALKATRTETRGSPTRSELEKWVRLSKTD